jgi:histone H2B
MPSSTKSIRKSKGASLSLATYVGRLHKQVHGQTTKMELSESTRRACSLLTQRLMARLAAEAGKQARVCRVKTVGSRHAAAAIKTVLNGDLGKHALAESSKVLAKFSSF